MNLPDQLKNFEGLDAKRTQGRWTAGRPLPGDMAYISYVGTDCDHEHVTGEFGQDGYNLECRTKDAQFIAAAPQILQALRESLELNRKLVEAANGVLDYTGRKCWFDHNGNCQEHGISNPCEVRVLLDSLDLAKSYGVGE